MENKLPKEDIQFIDTYLSNSDIHYEDIRIEMIDHVASDIEHKMNEGDSRGFYEIFKEYMIENKSSLEKQGKPFQWKVFKSTLKKFAANLVSFKVILGGILLFLALRFLDTMIYPFDDFTAMIIPMLMLFAITSVPIIRLRGKKYSFIGNFAIFQCVYFNLCVQLTLITDFNSTFFYAILFIWAFFSAASFKTMLDLSSYYNKNLQTI
ncbi:hypothetical protein [Aquimarina sp. MMG016]|uniref:hypothetical protein n=1 Tax=Aquimarina sp. MMG016 TaxID=2822690 RepID=UPI001B3A2134|nr:hypothetical protein [Aquimarina sp. MMG016]MBQ4820119.1 hypothetical protein [Aquimarina sp. MMG016]